MVAVKYTAKVTMTYDYLRTPFLKTIKLWALPPAQYNTLSGVAPLVTPRDSPAPSKGVQRLGVLKEFVALIPAASTFSQILCSVMLVMPLTKQLEFFDNNEAAKRWQDTARGSSTSSSNPEAIVGPVRPEDRALSARFPGEELPALYFQWHEGRAAQFRWGVKNERVFPVTELVRQSILVYLRRDILYKQIDYLEVMRETLEGYNGSESLNVAHCVHYLLLRMRNAMCLYLIFFFGLKFLFYS